MKFGSWTYDDNNLDLRHAAHTNESELDSVVPYGVDLHDYYLSVEWDLMQVPAHRHKVYYNSCCKESRYIDISFNITMRRKTVFYTVNLIIPCVGISCLTILVFYLPSDSGEKVTLCISILLSLTVFFLLLAEIIPPTSLAVPLLGKYLLFTMVLVTLSVGCTICVLNIGYRSPSTHRLSSRARRVLLEWLPPLLLIRRPQRAPSEPPLHELCEVESETQAELEGAGVELPPLTVRSAEHHQLCPALSAHLPSEPGPSRHQPVPDTPWSQPPSCGSPGPPWLGAASPGPSTAYVSSPGPSTLHRCPSGPSALRPGSLESVTSPDGWSVPSASRPVTSLIAQHEHLQKALQNVNTIASRINNLDAFEEVESDWRYVAMVLDRLFMWLFTVACTCGTCGILLQAPLLYDHTTPIDRIKSRVARANLSSMGDEDWQNREE
ncbi:acetylcholine receptor subunit alpha-like 1 [Amphibalanus amphitrite]|uniref:acetylcholine receptor subunit alpha-like 1 n=1 Tax=Amphibalanus amphitrite TaxID=1232801 RepID=UPI001C927F4D|nr:acetylcholine receptor subunit alpha-like 1 [Amphibalanus amphitrite]